VSFRHTLPSNTGTVHRCCCAEVQEARNTARHPDGAARQDMRDSCTSMYPGFSVVHACVMCAAAAGTQPCACRAAEAAAGCEP
jgi:hypothetical protein